MSAERDPVSPSPAETSPPETSPPVRRRRAWVYAPLGVCALAGAVLALRALLPTPDLSAGSKVVDWPERPIVAMPAEDVAAGNALVCAFVARDATGAEVSLVWADEDHPWPLCDEGYDLYRFAHYGRVMDVETYRWTAAGCELSRVFAGEQGFGTAVHESATLPLSAFERRGGRPVIYVRTWNHMLHAKPGAAPLRWVYLADYPVYRGDRAACEAALVR